MKVSKSAVNSTANLVGRLWGIVSTYIFIPIYIRYLGSSAYGLVSFFATLQAALTLLGMGLSSTLRREFAVGDESTETRRGKHLILRSVENVYYGIALLIFLICFCGADFIARKWLNIEQLDAGMVSTVIILMGFSIATQLVSNLYFGCILGLGKQVYANGCSLAWTISKSVGSVVICILWRDVTIFYIWHILVDVLYLIILRISINRFLNVRIHWNLSDFKNLKSIWKYAAGLFFISIVALVTKQFDKVLISKYLTLSELGAYNLATTLGNLAIIFASALSITALTDFTKLFSIHNEKSLEIKFCSVNELVAFITIAMGSFIAVYSYDIIIFWTGNMEYAELMKETAPLVVVALTLIGLQEIPYSLALAHGNTKTNMLTGVFSLPFIIVITFILISSKGLLGAGLAYIITMLFQTLIYITLIYRKYLPNKATILLFRDFFAPFVFCLTVAFISREIITKMNLANFIIVLLAIILGAISLFVMLLTIGRKSLLIFLGKGEH